MSEHTSFESFDAFLDAGGFETGEENLEAVFSEEDLDQRDRQTTSFGSWEEMREEAMYARAAEQRAAEQRTKLDQ